MVSSTNVSAKAPTLPMIGDHWVIDRRFMLCHPFIVCGVMAAQPVVIPQSCGGDELTALPQPFLDVLLSLSILFREEAETGMKPLTSVPGFADNAD
jgi:hypothetical protein